jgi:hypothetical protein
MAYKTREQAQDERESQGYGDQVEFNGQQYWTLTPEQAINWGKPRPGAEEDLHKYITKLPDGRAAVPLNIMQYAAKYNNPSFIDKIAGPGLALGAVGLGNLAFGGGLGGLFGSGAGAAESGLSAELAAGGNVPWQGAGAGGGGSYFDQLMQNMNLSAADPGLSTENWMSRVAGPEGGVDPWGGVDSAGSDDLMGSSGLPWNEDMAYYGPESAGTQPPAPVFDRSRPTQGLIDSVLNPVAAQLGLSVPALMKIIGAGAGGVASYVGGEKQKDISRDLINMTAPEREKFRSLNRADFMEQYRPILERGADIRGRQWSQNVGNPALSPKAMIATDRDLADLYETAFTNERKLYGDYGFNTPSIASGYNNLLNATADQAKGVGGAIGSILGTVAGSSPVNQSPTDRLLAMIENNPQMFFRS